MEQVIFPVFRFQLYFSYKIGSFLYSECPRANARHTLPSVLKGRTRRCLPREPDGPPDVPPGGGGSGQFVSLPSSPSPQSPPGHAHGDLRCPACPQFPSTSGAHAIVAQVLAGRLPVSTKAYRLRT